MDKQITEIIEKSIREGQNIGSSCMILKEGKELYFKAFGYADKEAGRPLKRDSIFRLFSLTKPVTSAAVMLLIDQNILSPESKLSDFFPEFSEMQCLDNEGNVVPCKTDITISHLLTMTSGLPYANWGNPSYNAAAKLFDEIIERQNAHTDITTEEFCRKAAEIPLLFEPSTKWVYGISADILGGVIEKASGMKLSQFLEKNFFEPLKMTDTGFYVPKEKLDRFTALYSWKNDKLERNYDNHLGLTDYTAPPAFESGGAGLVSTIGDYSKFASMLANSGVYEGKRYLSEEAFRYMTAPKLSPAQHSYLWDKLSGYSYGALMRIMVNKEASSVKTCNGEFGWDGWTGTYFCADAKNKIAVLYFTQICGAGTTYQASEISRIAYENFAEKN